MGKLTEKLSTFAKDTHLHGIKEAKEAKQPLERLFWLVVLSVAFALLIHELVAMSLAYHSQPTTTKISIIPVNFWPSITICPWNWLAENEMKKMGFSLPTYAAMHYLFFDQSAINNRQVHITSNTTEQFFNLEAIKSFTIDEIISRGAYKASGVLSGFYEARINISEQPTMNGLCYKSHDINPITSLKVEYAIFNYYLKPLYGGFADNESTTDCRNAVIFGNSDYEGFPTKHLVLPCSSHLTLKITGRLFTKVSTRERPCNPVSSQRSEKRCYSDGINSICKEIGKKPLYYPGLGQKARNVSTWLDPNNNCIMDPYFNSMEELEKIYNNLKHVCPAPCESWIYEASVLPLRSVMKDEWQHLTMQLSQPLYTWMVAEQLVYTMGSFVGSIGGQLSLWSGASIITICQIVYFWAIRRPDN